MSSSESPTRSFKDFIGWAFAALSVISGTLILTLYSGLRADVSAVDERARQHEIRITKTEDKVDAQKEILNDIRASIRDLDKKLETMLKK